ncbi:MAG: four-carbon acid sugar kinase family protein [Alphaproteobacteria bacterium]
MPVLLGCIADDFTGATDLASTLVEGGMRTVQLIDLPAADTPPPADVDAVVIALKSRSIAADEAVRQSRAALRWLQQAGARQFFFKYCSTFDSTDAGNIGPVADALLDDLGGRITIACPAFPVNGRTIFFGHLFVGDRLLSESGMQNHPLNPMTDPDLVRVLGRQTAHKVGLVDFRTVHAGADAVRQRLDRLAADGCRHAVVDAIANADLMAIGAACATLPLITGGSGVAMGLPENFRRAGLLADAGQADALPAVGGAGAVLSGSCSQATLRQIARFQSGHDSFRVDPLALAKGTDVAMEALEWAAARVGTAPVLIYASAAPDAVRAVQDRLGRAEAGALVERAMAAIGRGLVDRGVRRLVVAGGETSGAVVGALGVKALRIGPVIDPGVPATVALGEPPVALALKSGNFGGDDFFAKALEMMR